MPKEDGSGNWSLADFIAPKASTNPSPSDHIGGFAVTTGIGLKELVTRYLLVELGWQQELVVLVTG
jgi:5-methyltetrahydrofolate--homocysteine methyltransferase